MNTDKKKRESLRTASAPTFISMDINESGLSGRIIGAAFEVSNTLGAGFLEKVYKRALLQELRLRGMSAVAEVSFPVIYKGECVGEYFADIVVENSIVVELKCVDRFAGEHIAQCLNYLHASKMGLCLLLNFQRPTVEYKRIAGPAESRPNGECGVYTTSECPKC